MEVIIQLRVNSVYGQMSVQCFVGRMLVFISVEHLPKCRQPNRERDELETQRDREKERDR